MKILMTGIGGFVGGHLAELLSRGPHELYGTVRPGKSKEALAPLTLSKPVQLRETNLSDEHAVSSLIADLRPDAVIHLAAYAKNDDQNPDHFHRENVAVTQTLCQSLINNNSGSRLLFVSTGLVYGGLSDPSRDGFSEGDPLNPHGLYTISKAEAETVVLKSKADHGLDVVIARPFNHTGPRQSTDYPIPRFAKQVISIKPGQTGIINTRDLSSFRDYSDVRDVVAAYSLLLEKGVSGQCYNVGSGTAVQLRFVLERLIQLAHVQAEIREERQPHSAGNLRATRCNSHKLENLGWNRKYDLDATLKNVLTYWKETHLRSD